MSWDLAFWRGRPMEAPAKVCERLLDGKKVKLVEALVASKILAAFRAEYGDDLRVESSEKGVDIAGRGFEFAVSDGDRHFYVMCAWGFASDDDALAALVRAGHRAGCSAYDPQSGVFWEARLDGNVDDFVLYADDDDGGGEDFVEDE